MANGARRRRSGGGARRSGGSGGGGRSGGGGGRARSGGGGGRSRGSSRGRGGGNNAMPMIIGVVLIIGVIAIIAIVAGRDKGKKEPFVSTELTAESVVPKGDKPAGPVRPPAPNLPADIMAAAQEVVVDAADKKAQGDALYDEAMAAKNAGDSDTWQAKLHDAEALFIDIRDAWNGVIGDIEGSGITTDDWDAEQIANHWLGKEGDKITRMMEPLAYIKKQLRAN